MLGRKQEKVQEHKILVEFRGDDEKIMDERRMSLTYAFIDGTFPPVPEAGEQWEISFRKVASL